MQVNVLTDWNIGGLIDLQRDQILRVNHEYQRGLRWTETQKCMFIDSIFRSYSIPAFYFHKVEKGNRAIRNTYYDIVDGQQRIDAIYSYSEGSFTLLNPSSESNSRFPIFVREGDCPWGGKRFGDLSEELKEKLLETNVVVYELATTNENEIRDLFIRLQGGTPLTPQDKRDSWPGNFTEFVLRTGGKKGVEKWYGNSLFNEFFKVNESRRRQFVAQLYMQYFSVNTNNRFCDMKSINIDDFYHQHVGFDEKSNECRRFNKICQILHNAFSGKLNKIVGHSLIHSFLLADSLLDDYARGWEDRLANAILEFDRRCKKASEDNRNGIANEFEQYWNHYAQWTRTNADLGSTIQRRHTFYSREMIELLAPKKRDEIRRFTDFEKRLIFFRDSELCQFCKMQGEPHKISWAESEFHHVIPHSEGGSTSAENGALMHRDCHPKARGSVARFREWWENSDRGITR